MVRFARLATFLGRGGSGREGECKPIGFLVMLQVKKDAISGIGDIRGEAFGFSPMMLCMDFRLVVELVIMTITRSGMTSEAIEELINQRVAEALFVYEANRAAELAVESQSQNGDDDDNGNVGGNGNRNGGGNGDGNGGGNGNRNGGGNGNGNPNRNDRG
ncbi:hypothetical protein Tco_1536223 [Tanacetum coccineum]